ncbi:MAG: cation:proton antiporter [Candidatus Latescibacterota bacterium]
MIKTRGINKIAPLTILIGLSAVVLLTPLSRRGVAGGEAPFCLGFILLFGYYLANLLKGLRLPSISAYIAAGMLAGPYAINLLSQEVVQSLQLFDDAALAIIALIAGGEMKLRVLRSRAASFAGVIAGQLLFSFLGAGIVALALLDHLSLPIMEGSGAVVALALLLGLVMVARSPSTTIGVVTETRSRGPLTELIVGVTVIVDVLILILVAFIVPTAEMLLTPEQAFSFSFAEDLFITVFGSIAIGVFFGALIGSYLRWIRGYIPLFLVGVGFIGSLVCRHFDFEPLLTFMIAGFVITNFSAVGDDLIRGLEKSAFPVYVIFFAISGASIDLDALSVMWRFALLLVVVRALSFLAGGWLAGCFAQDVRGHAGTLWTGFLSQAGVTIGIASIIERKFGWGGELKTLILAAVAINQLVGPVLLMYLLGRKGEVGGMDRSDQ